MKSIPIMEKLNEINESGILENFVVLKSITSRNPMLIPNKLNISPGMPKNIRGRSIAPSRRIVRITSVA